MLTVVYLLDKSQAQYIKPKTAKTVHIEIKLNILYNNWVYCSTVVSSSGFIFGKSSSAHCSHCTTLMFLVMQS